MKNVNKKSAASFMSIIGMLVFCTLISVTDVLGAETVAPGVSQSNITQEQQTFVGPGPVKGIAITSAVIRRASSCSAADVQAAITAAKDGDTVEVAAGSCTWTSPVYINNKSITLKGAGIDQTIITDNTPSGNNNSPLHIRMDQNRPFRVTGFTFDGAAARTKNHGNGQIWIEGVSKSWRVDHVKIANNTYRGIATKGYLGETYGVIDHCIFEVKTNTSAQSVSVFGDNRGTTISGDNSWSLPLTLGTANAVYIEDCTFNYDYLNDGVLDAYGGARYVFRNNKVNGTSVGHHGFDSGGFRSTHSYEIYNNTFNNVKTSVFTTMFFRGGTGVVFKNTVTGNYSRFVTITNYRSNPNFEGNATNPSSSSTTLINDKATFTGVVAGARWYIHNVSDSSYCTVSGVPNTNTLVCDGLKGGKANTFRNGDQYAVVNWINTNGMCMGTSFIDGNQTSKEGYPCFDQVGRTTNQELSPLYQWGNTFKGNTSPIISLTGTKRQNTLHLVSGRDYYDNKPKPGYTPFAYPHPLTLK